MSCFVGIWDYVVSLAFFKLEVLLTASGRMQYGILFDKLLGIASIQQRTSCLTNNHIQNHYVCVRCDDMKRRVRQLNRMKDVLTQSS